MDITKLYQKQISLTEWFAQLGHKDTEALRKEDNTKRERLRFLHNEIGLPYNEVHEFPAQDIAHQTVAFKRFLAEHGNELCALRLVPYDDKLPKLRMRGHTIRDALAWFSEQQIDPKQYKAEFVPHAEVSTWSTIFIVNSHGVFGEIIAGGHHQLTQGFYKEARPITFAADSHRLRFSERNSAAEEHVRAVLACLHVPDKHKQQILAEKFGATFSHDYLCGYFETVESEGLDMEFIDYSRTLGEHYKDFTVSLSETGEGIPGQIGSKGKATGRVRIVPVEQIGHVALHHDEVLVCSMTSPDYLPLMRSAAAIVTDLGGILSHAAITARELHKPCIVGTRVATQQLKDGDMVEVDADTGVVRVL